MSEWTVDQVVDFVSLYPIRNKDFLCEKLDKTREQLSIMSARMHLSGIVSLMREKRKVARKTTRKPWFRWEEKYIFEKYGLMATADIAKELGRTVDAVTARWYKLKNNARG